MPRTNTTPASSGAASLIVGTLLPSALPCDPWRTRYRASPWDTRSPRGSERPTERREPRADGVAVGHGVPEAVVEEPPLRRALGDVQLDRPRGATDPVVELPAGEHVVGAERIASADVPGLADTIIGHDHGPL